MFLNHTCNLIVKLDKMLTYMQFCHSHKLFYHYFTDSTVKTVNNNNSNDHITDEKINLDSITLYETCPDIITLAYLLYYHTSLIFFAKLSKYCKESNVYDSAGEEKCGTDWLFCQC